MPTKMKMVVRVSRRKGEILARRPDGAGGVANGGVSKSLSIFSTQKKIVVFVCVYFFQTSHEKRLDRKINGSRWFIDYLPGFDDPGISCTQTRGQ